MVLGSNDAVARGAFPRHVQVHKLAGVVLHTEAVPAHGSTENAEKLQSPLMEAFSQLKFPPLRLCQVDIQLTYTTRKRKVLPNWLKVPVVEAVSSTP